MPAEHEPGRAATTQDRRGREVSRVHGGPDARELSALGLTGAELLDFSVNVNPFGAAPEMLAAIRGAPLDRYPDEHALAARRALGAAWGISADRIAVGNGAAELLWTLVQVVCRGRGPLLVVAPTFGEPALAAHAHGVPVHHVVTQPIDGFAVDVATVVDRVRATGARAVYLTSPQNPTGRLVPPTTTAALASALPEITILLDEAFLPLSHGFAAAKHPLPENVVRVRSLTKEHALPGLRVGALIGPVALVDQLALARPAWTVSAPALAAAEAAAGLGAFVNDLRTRWLGDAARMSARLVDFFRRSAPRITVLPSDTVFLLVGLPMPAAPLRAALLQRHHLLVRDCASFGLPHHIRVCARSEVDVDRLVEGMRDTLPSLMEK